MKVIALALLVICMLHISTGQTDEYYDSENYEDCDTEISDDSNSQDYEDGNIENSKDSNGPNSGHSNSETSEDSNSQDSEDSNSEDSEDSCKGPPIANSSNENLSVKQRMTLERIEEAIKALLQIRDQIEQDLRQSTQHNSEYPRTTVQPMPFADREQSTADARLPAQIVPDPSESDFFLFLLII